MELIGKYTPSALVVLDLTWNRAREDEPDGWLADLCDTVAQRFEGDEGLICAPDSDGTIVGCDGAHVLVPREFSETWEEVAEEIGLAVVERNAVAGHYGDGGWFGVDLCEAPDGDLYWILRG